MKTAERHHLKTNELADSVARFRQNFETLGPQVGRAVLAVVVVLVLVGAVFAWRNYSASKSQSLLAEALAVDGAQIVPPPPPAAPGQPAPEPPPAGSFPTEEARRDAALPKLVAVFTAYPSSEAGRLARYRAASIYADMGKLADAEREFKVLADGGSGLYAEMSRLGLAGLQVRQGQYDPAIATFKEMATRTDGNLPVDGVLLQLGRAQVLAGKKTDALQTFTRIVDEFPQSLYVTEARREVETLKAGA